MDIEPLDIEQASAYYDDQRQIIRIQYKGKLDAQVPTIVYNWIDELIKVVGIETVQGEIFDFRDVVQFEADNLLAARKKSRRMNLKLPVHHFPVAMIVKNFYHEEILRGPMQQVPENKRKAIVHSEAEALEFIEAWHKENS